MGKRAFRVDNTDSNLISLNDTKQQSTGNFFDDHTRRLMQGYRKVLVVRVVDSSGVSTAASAQDLSHKMFEAGAELCESVLRLLLQQASIWTHRILERK